jgi:hypothetical protein
MSNTSLPSAVPLRPPALARGRNPFFLLSAVSMFAGVRVILSALNPVPGDVSRLLVLIATLNVYEALVIGLALLLITRRHQLRDGWILLSIEALFLVDLTLLNSELFTANLRWGVAINAACWGLALAKVAIVLRTLRLRLSGSEWVYAAMQFAAVFFIAGALKQIARHQHVPGYISPMALYAGWWFAGGMLVLATLMLRKPGERDAMNPMAALPGRLYVFLPFFSLLVHLAGANRVYWVHFHIANVAPVLLGFAVLLTRWHGRLGRSAVVTMQAILATAAIAISVNFDPHLIGHVVGHAFSPLRLSLVGSSAVMGTAFLLYRELIAAQLSTAAMVAASLGNSPGEMRANALAMAKAIYRGGVRLIPHTPMQWGVLAVIGSFVMLALGAVVSLRKHPPLAPLPEPVVEDLPEV